jgi:hypothetical protein
MAKISIEELAQAGVIEEATSKVRNDIYRLVKYKVPAGRSGKFYIRVFKNGTLCTNTKDALAEIHTRISSNADLNDNANTFGNAILPTMHAFNLAQKEAAERKKAEQERIRKEQEVQRLQKIAEEKARVEAERKEKLERERQAKLDQDLEGLFQEYQDLENTLVQKHQLEIEAAQLKPTRPKFSMSLRGWITTAVIIISIFMGSSYQMNNLKISTAKADLLKVEKQLNESKKGLISKDIQQEISKETSDTADIIKKSNVDQMDSERLRLAALLLEAKQENKAIVSLLDENQMLQQLDKISTSDKKALQVLANDSKTYSNFSDYQTQSNNLFDLVKAHESQTEALSTAADLLKDSNLSKADLTQLNTLMQKLQKASETDEINAAVEKLNSEIDTAKLNIQEKKLFDKAKSDAQSVIKQAQDAMRAQYVSDADKATLQKAIDKINAAKLSTDVTSATSDLQPIISEVNARTTQAKSAAEAQAAADAKAAQAAAEKQAAEQATANQATEQASSNPTSSGDWTTAAAGYVCVSGSNKYYPSVKNPGNYLYETVDQAQASGASPGHPNGSAH